MRTKTLNQVILFISNYLAQEIMEYPVLRRHTQLLEMMMYFNPTFQLPKHGAYGCKCNLLIGDRPMSGMGFGPVPVDSDSKAVSEKK